MAVQVNIFFFKTNTVVDGGAILVGSSILQNRCESKVNHANSAIGDGVYFLPISTWLNQDSDFVDSFSMDGPNLIRRG